MTINLTVVLKSKEEFTGKIKELLEKLVENSRQESGCLQYDLHQNIENPTIFILHEVWENKVIFDLHNSQHYVKDFFKLTPNLLKENPEVFFTNRLG
jgi:quinol monooxygenase YgiN